LAPTSQARSRAKAANTAACIPWAQGCAEPPPQTRPKFSSFSVGPYLNGAACTRHLTPHHHHVICSWFLARSMDQIWK
jgi:hypothetical protein